MSNLQDSEREPSINYELLVENTSDLVSILNEDLTVNFINKAAHLEQLSYTEDEILGNNLKDLVHFKDFVKLSDTFRDSFNLGEATVEARLRHKKGHYIWFELKIRTFFDKNQDRKAVVVAREITEHKNVERFISEISERRRTEDLIKKEIQKIKEFDKIRNDLISGISHELKTPLMSINGACELILDVYKDQLGKDALELIKMMSRGAERLGILIEKLLDISRIQFDKLELEKKNENLSKIIIECIEEISYFLKERKIYLEKKLDNNLRLSVDKLRIEQVVTNLLLNAIKNTPPMGKIEIILFEKSDKVEIIVKDTGIGLTGDEMKKLFTKFGKIERSGEGFEFLDIQGSGLGLFITKQIVEMHGGMIFARSDGRNKGSVFTVLLPIHPINNSN